MDLTPTPHFGNQRRTQWLNQLRNIVEGTINSDGEFEEAGEYLHKTATNDQTVTSFVTFNGRIEAYDSDGIRHLWLGDNNAFNDGYTSGIAITSDGSANIGTYGSGGVGTPGPGIVVGGPDWTRPAGGGTTWAGRIVFHCAETKSFQWKAIVGSAGITAPNIAELSASSFDLLFNQSGTLDQRFKKGVHSFHVFADAGPNAGVYEDNAYNNQWTRNVPNGHALRFSVQDVSKLTVDGDGVKHWASATVRGLHNVSALTANRDWAWPDKSGTVAMTSDITSGTFSGILGVDKGGTGADLSATGGANQVVRQSSVGGAFTVSALAAADIPNLDAAKVTTGVFNHARLGTGGGGSSKFLREDGTWQTVSTLPGGGTTAQFLRGDGTWTDTLAGPLSITNRLLFSGSGTTTGATNEIVANTSSGFFYNVSSTSLQHYFRLGGTTFASIGTQSFGGLALSGIPVTWASDGAALSGAIYGIGRTSGFLNFTVPAGAAFALRIGGATHWQINTGKLIATDTGSTVNTNYEFVRTTNGWQSNVPNTKDHRFSVNATDKVIIDGTYTQVLNKLQLAAAAAPSGAGPVQYATVNVAGTDYRVRLWAV